MKLHRDADFDLGPLRNRSVTIIGYGSQGRAQALNLRDAGVKVRVAVRPGPSADKARSDGCEVVRLDGITDADVLAFLLPDLAQPALFQEYVLPRLSGQTLLFAHGFNIHYRTIVPPPQCDVVLVAPKAPGRKVRETFVAGSGVPCLVAIHQDSSGNARPLALAYARGLGGGRAGIVETTFQEETETDLFGEQAVLCGGMTKLVLAGFETLVAAGYQPEVAYFECLHELKLIVDLLYEGGLEKMHRFVSHTAKYGALTRGGRVIDDHVRRTLQQLLGEIQDGTFAREWIAEVRHGMPRFKELLTKEKQHPLEAVGQKLRSLMEGEQP